MNSFKSLSLLIVLWVLFSVGASMYVNNDENTTNANEPQNENQDVTNSDDHTPEYVTSILPQDLIDITDGQKRTRDENTTNANESQYENQDVTNSDDDTPDYVIDTWQQDLIDSIAGQNRTEELEKLAAGNRRKRSASCERTGVLKIVAFYDDAFVNRFGSNANAEVRLQAVYAHMQTFMDLESLSVNVNGVVINRFRLDVVEMRHLSGRTISASSAGLRAFKNYVKKNTGNGDLRTDIQAYMLFSTQNDQGGTVGIAWLGTTCSNLQLRTSLNEYIIDDVVTAEIAVHELAHNLGAEHDFISSPDDPRYDSNGNLCTGIGGVMDYYNVPDKWSTCSNEDIGAYFSSLDTLCFPIEGDCPIPTSTAAPMPTTTERPECSCWMKRFWKRRRCCKATISVGFCCDGCRRWC